jgi:hypothetical protein
VSGARLELEVGGVEVIETWRLPWRSPACLDPLLCNLSVSTQRSLRMAGMMQAAVSKDVLHTQGVLRMFHRLQSEHMPWQEVVITLGNCRVFGRILYWGEKRWIQGDSLLAGGENVRACLPREASRLQSSQLRPILHCSGSMCSTAPRPCAPALAS